MLSLQLDTGFHLWQDEETGARSFPASHQPRSAQPPSRRMKEAPAIE